MTSNFPDMEGPSHNVVSVGEFRKGKWDGKLGQFRCGGLHMGFSGAMVWRHVVEVV